ncbi:putative rho guanyl nucleotide exchange factor protein [Neofusicoccum parvum UCRNP2]|uniref:Putative rho guanyl nucleotide exchange factor protein n=1 Tax=Botryosphaeria parva (strain UCR-NP2) TaxID=1287680 RepID=R1GCV7_BOTPV|nr:putative rho guanyl nucleotide exchange factor protein [Neofusicoccum parvum UCRNP2]
MADYSAQQGREYGRPANYGHTSDFQRDAAFNNIFGARPADRSQTMTSQSFQRPPDRAATMSSQVSDMMQRMPPMRPGANGYGSPQPNGFPPPRGPPDGPAPPRGQPQNHYLPQPLRPDRRPYNMPQRMDPRGMPPPQQYPNKPLPQRLPPGHPGPALNSDAYRSQSLASAPRPQMYPPGGGYNMNPAHTFRQAPYVNQARTTAQGRVVPERLRDSQAEVYQFRETLMEDSTEVNGVFTLLTECYSPTCTRDKLCYSIACPRRLEQQARLNLKPQPGLKKQESKTSLHDDNDDDEKKLWIMTVSKEIADSITEKEKKRQEVISELMYTERDFVKDLEYLRDFWMKPLRNPTTSPIPEHRREKFIRTVFSNCQEVYKVNARLAESLTRRQQVEPVVANVGDIFLEYVPHFAPFIKYGANQLFGKYEFEHEKKTNPAFARFVEEVERMKESRKLELNGYLTKPTTRLARYPLLLENVLKYTADDNPDKNDIPKAIVIIKDTLSKVNIESGKAENHFNLVQLNRDLKFRPGEYVDLKLTEENRQLIFKGSLKKTPTDNTSDIQAYLFDHAVLLVRIKTVNKKEEMKVYKKPIPLELLVITQMEEVLPKQGAKAENKQQGYPITFKHLGKGGYEQTLYASTQISQEKWMKHIQTQQRNLRDRSNIFTKDIVCEGFFNQSIKVNCYGGRKLAYGTDFGVYVADRRPRDASIKPKRVLECKAVTQIDVLEQHQILLVLSDKTMYSYPLEALDPDENQGSASKRGRKICHANFFKAGVCVGQHLVCCVKTSALSTTIKVYEPMENMAKKSKKTGFSRMLAGGQDVLKPYKEFYIPTESTSIHFLRSKLCVGCAKGFEVVSLETLETQSLLDQADTSLDFVARRENIKPIHIERLSSEFLLCYTDFSFFVNRNGWRARPDWKITWEGTPQAFAIFNPYILAFEPSFIEIRHMETGMLVHILTAKNIRMLHSSTREILYAYEDEMGEDTIASLDFWSRPQSPPGQQGQQGQQQPSVPPQIPAQSFSP